MFHSHQAHHRCPQSLSPPPLARTSPTIAVPRSLFHSPPTQFAGLHQPTRRALSLSLLKAQVKNLPQLKSKSKSLTMKDHHRSDIHVFASNASSRTKNKAISITPGNDCKLLKRAKNLSMLVKGSIEKHPHPIIIDDDDDDIVVVERFSSRKKRKPWISEQAGNCESSSGLKWEERINDDEDPIIIIEEKGIVCEICAESKPQNESFRIKGCLHSYCSDCMSSYVTSKLENGVSQINCPVPGCCYSGTLDPEHCKEILPFEVFVRWGQLLCESSIPASQKFYCPFKDCSALLLSDATETVTSSECPFCFRLFCAQCRAGWHEGITCAEYQALDEDEREGKDIMLNNLAKSSNWKRCPYCKIYVEKVVEVGARTEV